MELADQFSDERRARVAVAMLSEPLDAVTGRNLRAHGAVGLLRVLERDDPIIGMNRADGLAWRQRLTDRISGDFPARVREIEQLGLATVMPGDPHWPASLNELGDRAPHILWARGATSFLTRPLHEVVTMTGARAATAYGEHVAHEPATELTEQGHIMVAGGAYGIDRAAHHAALASGGDTIAVLVGGLDRPYPSGNRDLFDQIASTGLLISELPPEQAPTRHRFLARNRLLAALSGASIIVEAGARSVSLDVVARAAELGRPVEEVPGPVTSPVSFGPHRLIREGAGSTVTSASDVVDLLNPPTAHRDRGIGSDSVRRIQTREGRGL